MEEKDTYRCQFCGEETPCDQWEKDTICPKCGKEYDAILAQDADDE